MKTIHRSLLNCAALLASLFIFTGASCRNPESTIGPDLLRLGVSTGAGYGILKNPKAVPAVRAGAEVICSAAYGTNLSPANLVAALDAYGERTPESIFILNGAISAYSLVYHGLSSTNPVVVRPYTQAVCNGLHDALLLVGPPAPGTLAAPHSHPLDLTERLRSDWPQVKFK